MEATGAGGSLASFFPSIFHYTAFLTMLQLPEDISLHILKQLDVDSDEPTIRNASLVSTAFREPCQKLLFSTLRLKPPKSFKSTYRYTPGARLLRLLKSSPVIMGYIQGITIIDSTPGSGADQPSWLSLDGRLAEALNQLSFTKIRRFELAMEYRLHWNHLNAPIQKTILAICRSPSLVSLSLTCAPIGLVETSQAVRRGDGGALEECWKGLLDGSGHAESAG
ncbi:hypothetical protein CC2G_004222 [Coprinopsis cinerea AmutBmut pab1-1]|nr:hypothetical protein CC2G_004222 [Coprinopsis cinerea AmutBmut pab1-1]